MKPPGLITLFTRRRTRSGRLPAIICVAAIACLCLPQAAHALSFRASGTVLGIPHFTSKYPGQNREVKFVIERSDCTWRITITDPESKGMKSFEAACDGSRVYYLRRAKDTPAFAKASNDAVAVVLPGIVPVGSKKFGLPIIWMFLASDCYFMREHSSLQDLFASSINPYVLTNKHPAGISMRKTPPFLIKSIAQMHPGFRASWEQARVGPWLFPPDKIAFTRPYDKGYIERTFKVLKYGRDGNIDFPRKCESRLYFPDFQSAKPTPSMILLDITELTIDQFSRLDKRGPSVRVPDISSQKGVFCADFRFALNTEDRVFGSISYLFSGAWWSDKRLKSSKEFRFSVKKTRDVYPLIYSTAFRDRMWMSHARWLTLLLLAAVSTTFIILLRRAKKPK